MSTFEIIMAIINVAALIIVPIAAVFIGQKLQDRNQKRKDKMEIFRVLMMNRGIGWTADTVRALNIIDVVFSDDDSVRARWRSIITSSVFRHQMLCSASKSKRHKTNY